MSRKGAIVIVWTVVFALSSPGIGGVELSDQVRVLYIYVLCCELLILAI